MRRRSASSIRSSGRRRVDSARSQRYVERSLSACSGMSRPATAPSRSRLERAQSSPAARMQARRGEQEGGQTVESEETGAGATARIPRKSAEIEDFHSGEEIEELTSVHDEGQGNA